MQPRTTASRVSQACDACRARKVRCNGQQPCPPCEHMNLHCKFSKNHGENSKPRSAPRRNKILTQLRVDQKKAAKGLRHLAIAPTGSPENGSESPQQATQPELAPKTSDLDFGAGLSGSIDETTWFLSLLPLYEQYVYIVNPIVTRQELQDSIHRMHIDLQEHGAFAYAAIATTINLSPLSADLEPHQEPTLPDWSDYHCRTEQERLAQLRYLVNKCDNIRHHHPASDSKEMIPRRDVTIRQIMTCVFLAICVIGLERKENAWLAQREAINLMHLLSYNEKYDNLIKHQRLYWLLFIHDRFSALTLGLPPMLTAASQYPSRDTSIPGHVDAGFVRICQLFSIVDSKFMRHWIKYQGNSQKMGPVFCNHQLEDDEMTSAWIESKHQELDADEKNQDENSNNTLTRSGKSRPKDRHLDNANVENDVDDASNMTELQNIDLQVTRLWIHTLLWQLAASRMFLNSASLSTSHQAMSLTFPARHVVIQLRGHVSRLENRNSLSTHGSSILEKLFEITNSIADVLLLMPRDEYTSSGSPGISQQRGKHAPLHEDFEFLVNFLFSFIRMDQIQRNIIQEKSTALGVNLSDTQGVQQ